jgi:hypothetical protein
MVGIKGFEKPKSCRECFFGFSVLETFVCEFNPLETYELPAGEQRLLECPLVKVVEA